MSPALRRQRQAGQGYTLILTHRDNGDLIQATMPAGSAEADGHIVSEVFRQGRDRGCWLPKLWVPGSLITSLI